MQKTMRGLAESEHQSLKPYIPPYETRTQRAKAPMSEGEMSAFEGDPDHPATPYASLRIGEREEPVQHR